MPLVGGAHRDPIIFSRRLDENGDGTGNSDALGNYSIGSPGIFFVQPPSNEIYVINKLIFNIGGSEVKKANDYGDIGGGLPNGILVEVYAGNTLVGNFTPDEPISNNATLFRITSQYVVTPFTDGLDYLKAVYSIAEDTTPMLLQGDLNMSLRVTCQDNLSSLISHTFSVLGYR